MPSTKPPRPESYLDILTDAINEFDQTGYTSADRLAYWQQRLREAAERETLPPGLMEANLRDVLTAAYVSMIDKGGYARYHPGVSRFTVDQLRPEMRAELTRRILASADLIKLNRKQAIEKTLQRFSGWATSIPKGGAANPKKVKTKQEIRKSLTSLPFEERRVLIDQGHKLVSSINDIVAKGGGAIAAVWRSHFRQAGYNYRPDHKARDGKIYLIRDSWAQQRGYVKPSRDGYADEITQPGEEIFCRCYFIYKYSLRDLPPSMLTKKGEVVMAEAREKLNAMVA